jgi:hypothetical protein
MKKKGKLEKKINKKNEKKGKGKFEKKERGMHSGLLL